jgi:hypothetical protein
MDQNTTSPLARRAVLAGAGLALAGLTAAAKAASVRPKLTVYHDPACGCCKAWTKHIAAAGFAVAAVPTADIAAVKQRLGVPAELQSCHTATVGGFIIEGHVPGTDIDRLLAAKPYGVRGLAVPGMPLGSPGMEVPDARRDAYQVVAFGPAGISVFARHG